jgi:hypothetical protein
MAKGRKLDVPLFAMTCRRNRKSPDLDSNHDKLIFRWRLS